MMAKRKKAKGQGPMNRLKWETAKELGLVDDLKNAGDDLTSGEAGKLGGTMVQKLVREGKQSLKRQGSIHKEPKL